MQPLVHARVTENYPFSSKENYNRKHIRRGRTCTRKTSSLTRLNDVLRKTLLQEAKQNARSSEFFSELGARRIQSAYRCAVYRHLRENGADCAIYRHEVGGGGGGGRKIFLFHKRLLMTLIIYVLINVEFNGKR